MAKRAKADKIPLGSGHLLIKEYDEATGFPGFEDFSLETDRLGFISGGATIEYNSSSEKVTDDLGYVSKVVTTEESAVLKSGLMTWNGTTLEKLVATARASVSDDGKYRTVKIGGLANANDKSYCLCFWHQDAVDGDIWVLIRGKNKAAFSFTFAKDQPSVIDVEFECMPLDDEGTLITYVEEIADDTEAAAAETGAEE